jgi:hypothetical protein
LLNNTLLLVAGWLEMDCITFNDDNWWCGGQDLFGQALQANVRRRRLFSLISRFHAIR